MPFGITFAPLWHHFSLLFRHRFLHRFLDVLFPDFWLHLGSLWDLFALFIKNGPKMAPKMGPGDNPGGVLLATGVPLAPLWRLPAILHAFWSQFWLPFSSLLHPFYKNNWICASFFQHFAKLTRPCRNVFPLFFGYGSAHLRFLFCAPLGRAVTPALRAQ